MAKKIKEISNEGPTENAKIRDNVAKLSALIAQLIVQLLNLDTNIQGRIDEVKKLAETAFLDTSAEIHKAKDEIIQKVESLGESINKKVDDLKESIFQELKK